MRRALITGLYGFTGCYLKVELEAAGWQVFGIGTMEMPTDGQYRHVELGDTVGLQEWIDEVQPDAVVHLAGIAFVGHGDANAFYDVNLVGTRNLLAALAASDKQPDCVLLASSANIYGNSAEGVLDESMPPNPANDYAVSKLAMEYMARLWLDKLPIVIARPFNYTGVGQSESFLLPKIVAHYRRRATMIELGNLDVERDFSDVRAVARIYRQMVERAAAGQVFNVCSGKAIALKDVLMMMAGIAGYEIEVRVNPAFVRTNEVKSLCGDAGKLKSLLGSVESIPLQDTLRWMYGAA